MDSDDLISNESHARVNHKVHWFLDAEMILHPLCYPLKTSLKQSVSDIEPRTDWLIERFSASSLCSDGWVVRVWVRIPTATVVLICPWAWHFTCTIIASLHPGVNGYLWGQSWLLCLISHICAEMAAIELYTPRELRWFQEWLMRLMSRGNNIMRLEHQKLVDTCTV